MTRMQIVIQVDGETIGPIDDVALDQPRTVQFLEDRLRLVADRLELWRKFREILPKEEP